MQRRQANKRKLPVSFVQEKQTKKPEKNEVIDLEALPLIKEKPSRIISKSFEVFMLSDIFEIIAANLWREDPGSNCQICSKCVVYFRIICLLGNRSIFRANLIKILQIKGDHMCFESPDMPFNDNLWLDVITSLEESPTHRKIYQAELLIWLYEESGSLKKGGDLIYFAGNDIENFYSINLESIVMWIIYNNRFDFLKVIWYSVIVAFEHSKVKKFIDHAALVRFTKVRAYKNSSDKYTVYDYLVRALLD